MNNLNNKQTVVYKSFNGTLYHSKLEAVRNFEQYLQTVKLVYFKEVK